MWVRILQSCKPGTVFINVPAAATKALSLHPGDLIKISLGDSVLILEPMALNRNQGANKPQAQPNDG